MIHIEAEKRVTRVTPLRDPSKRDASKINLPKTRHAQKTPCELQKLETLQDRVTHVTRLPYLSANAHTRTHTHMSQPIIRKRVTRVTRVTGLAR